MASSRPPQKRPPGSSGGDPGIPDIDEVRANIEKRLFVGRMPTDTTEEALMDLFSDFGPITEVRVLPGKGVAFVGLETWAAAHRAMIATNGSRQLPNQAEGQTLHVKFAERSGCERTAVVYSKGLEFTRLFVGGLPEDTMEDDLEELCAPYGEIRDLSLLPMKGQGRRRCGFVTYALWGEALDAVEALDGQPHPASGENLKVNFAQESASSQRREAAAAVNDVADAKRRRAGGAEGGGGPAPRPRASEFAQLRDEYLAALEDGSPREACDRLHRLLMDARPSRAGHRGAGGGRPAPPPPPRAPSPPPPRAAAPPVSSRRAGGGRGAAPANGQEREPRRLFISGLPSGCMEEELAHLVNQLPFHASRHGRDLVDCRVLPGRGSGYVTFSSREAASEALAELHDRQVKGWERPLRARWAAPGDGEGERRERERERSPPREAQNGRGGGRGAPPRGGEAPRFRPGGAADDSHVDYRRLFVGQLQPMEAGQERLHSLFEAFGPIEECRYLDRKGVAFVTFDRERDARAAVAELNGATVAGISRNDGLSVKFAQIR